MANDITEEEVPKDVMVCANVLFERGITDDPLGFVDTWVTDWRSGGLAACRAADGRLRWKALDRELEA